MRNAPLFTLCLGFATSMACQGTDSTPRGDDGVLVAMPVGRLDLFPRHSAADTQYHVESHHQLE